MTGRNVIARLTDVSVGFPAMDGTVENVIDRVSLTIHFGERIGLLGASGSGKSLTALSLLGLVPPPGAIVGGSVEIQGTDILTSSKTERSRLRGGAVGMVFQEAEAALNPVMTIGAHLEETIRQHRPNESSRWRHIAVGLLENVDLDPVRTLKSHPHRLSGGQRQRALLAIALAGDPHLIIADEPTSSLDQQTSSQVESLLRHWRQKDDGRAMLIITHDGSQAERMADRIVRIERGRIVDEGGHP